MAKQWYGRGIQRWWKFSMWASFALCLALPITALVWTWCN